MFLLEMILNWNFLKLSCFLWLYGCATTVGPSNFYWGNYSHTLYQYKKDPNKKTYDKHKNELSRIVKRSRELKLTPPPGVQAELGYLMFKEAKHDRALNLIKEESQSYPESILLMKKVQQNMEKK